MRIRCTPSFALTLGAQVWLLGGCGGGTETVHPDAGLDAEAIADAAPADARIDGSADPCAGVTCEECAFYVDVAAAAGGDGTTPDTAFTTVQPAVEAAHEAAGECCRCEVRVAEGTYHVHEDGASDTISLRERVDVLGGYPAGFDGARDVELHETVLDGRALADTGLPDDSLRVYHVVTGADDALLDGFTVQYGDAAADDDVANVDNYGGGMLNVAVSPTVSRCRFTANHAVHGGGVFSSLSAARFQDCRFDLNEADEDGGGMDNRRGDVQVADCQFTGNAATAGGGLHSGGDDRTLVSGDGSSTCLFEDNAAVETGGGMDSEGAAPRVTGCVFRQNAAGDGGGLSSRAASRTTIEDSLFEGNQAARGGGVLGLDGASHEITGSAPGACGFDSNSAVEAGGGLASIGADAQVSGCTFFRNAIAAPAPEEPVGRGAGIHTEDGALEVTDSDFTWQTIEHCEDLGPDGIWCDGRGGALSTLRATAEIAGCTFDGNRAAHGVAVYGEQSTTSISGSTFVDGGLPSACATSFGCPRASVVHAVGGILELSASDLSSNDVFQVVEGELDARLTVTGCRFVGNTGLAGLIESWDDSGLVPAARFESCLFLANGSGTGSWPRVLDTTHGALEVVNCTFVANQSGTWAVLVRVECTGGHGSASVVNSIAWSNGGAPLYDPIVGTSCSRLVTHSDVEGALLPGAGNLNVDPVFADTSALDPRDWDLRLSPSSPCIDGGSSEAASASIDLDGLPRLVGDAVDMGAYEVQEVTP